MSSTDENHRLPDLAMIGEMIGQFTLRAPSLDIPEVVQLIGIKTEGAGSSQWANQVFAQIGEFVRPDKYGVRSHVDDLLSQHLFAYQLEGASLEPVLSVLHAIRSVQAPQDLRKTGSPIDWRRLVESAYVYRQLRGAYVTKEDWWRSFPREYAIGQAARRLRDRGYAIAQNAQGPTLDDSECDRLVARLEHLVVTIGGLNVIHQIFRVVTPRYDASMERFQLIREQHLGTVPAVTLPFGYLLALSAKHLGSRGGQADASEAWRELVALATDFAAIHDVQEYAPLVFVRPSTGELPSLLAKRALYDSLSTFPQLRPRDVGRILRGLLYALPTDAVHGSGWTLDDLFAVIDHIYACIGARRGPAILNVRSLARNVPGVRPALAKSILLDVFCHRSAGPNQRFSRPTDMTVRGGDPFTTPGNNLYFRPLARLGKDCVVVLDRSAAGPAFVEAVLAAMRDIVGKTFQDQVVGPGVEHLVRQELLARGITAVRGDYDVPNVHGECDLVIDAADRLAFIELKAKALTRDANAGSDVDVTLSLSGSVIAAQQQAMGHELELRRNGKLTLVEEGSVDSYGLTWRGQTVDRIALGIFDYGAFQDRTAVAQLLNHVLGARYDAINDVVRAQRKGELKKLNDSLEKLSRYVEAWPAVNANQHDAFSNCWFMSVPQLLLLLEDVTGPDDFFSNLDVLRRLTYQTCNFYFEYREAKKLYAYRRQLSTA